MTRSLSASAHRSLHMPTSTPCMPLAGLRCGRVTCSKENSHGTADHFLHQPSSLALKQRFALVGFTLPLMYVHKPCTRCCCRGLCPLRVCLRVCVLCVLSMCPCPVCAVHVSVSASVSLCVCVCVCLSVCLSVISWHPLSLLFFPATVQATVTLITPAEPCFRATIQQLSTARELYVAFLKRGSIPAAESFWRIVGICCDAHRSSESIRNPKEVCSTACDFSILMLHTSRRTQLTSLHDSLPPTQCGVVTFQLEQQNLFLSLRFSRNRGASHRGGCFLCSQLLHACMNHLTKQSLREACINHVLFLDCCALYVVLWLRNLYRPITGPWENGACTFRRRK